MSRRLALSLAAVALAACSTDDRPASPTAPDAPRLAASAGGVAEVTTGADAGPGSLRAAIARANADASVRTIRVRNNLGPIAVATPLVYRGAQALTIDGGGVVLDGAALVAQDAAENGVLVATGGADLTLRRVVVRHSTGNGIVVDLTANTRARTVEVQLLDVTVADSDEHGVVINEQTDFFTRDLESNVEAGTPADLRVVVRDSRFLRNGFSALDRDGLRVNEGGPGSLHAEIAHAVFDGNGADGVELDERGAGDVVYAVRQTRITGNGFYDVTAADLDDGIDVDERGAGDHVATLVQVVATGNAEEGIDLNENNLGDLRVELQQVTASGNGEEGIDLEEDDDWSDRAGYLDPAWGGSLYVTATGVTADGNGGDAGLKLRERFDGGVATRLVNAAARDNAAGGVSVREQEAGSLDAELVNVEARRNRGEGIELRQDGAGAIGARVQRAVSSDNGGAALRLRDAGTARVQALVATGNGFPVPIRATGVVVTEIP